MNAEQYIPPWSSPYIIGIAGLSGSGKTTVAQEIISSINEPWTVLLSLDNFYNELTPEQKERAYNSAYDFDHPDAVDMDLIYESLKSIKQGKRTDIPVYSFTSHSRVPDEKITIYGANVVIIEGIFTLYSQKILDLMDCKVFVDTDIDICYTRRLLRDIVHRGREISSVIKQWDTFVKPNAVSYLLPTRANADIVIPRGSDNYIALEFLIEHLKRQLHKKSIQHVQHLKSLGRQIKPVNWSQVHILENTNQLKAIKTIILDKQSSIDDFIFYFNRIASILISESLNYATYTPGSEFSSPKSITTPVGFTLPTKDAWFLTSDVVAVSIIRSGDCFIRSIRRIIPSARIGKLLIQTDSRTGEPQLHTEKLPVVSKETKILLFDAQTISGAAAIMAIKVLLDHGVEESQIVLVSYTATEIGIRRIFNAFPQVELVVACIGSRITQIDSIMETSDDISPKFVGDSHINNKEHDVNSDDDWWMSNRFIDNVYFGTI